MSESGAYAIAEQQLVECGKIGVRPDHNDEEMGLYCARQFAGCIDANRLTEREMFVLVQVACDRYILTTGGRPQITSKVFGDECRRQIEANRVNLVCQRQELAEIASLRALHEQRLTSAEPEASVSSPH